MEEEGQEEGEDNYEEDDNDDDEDDDEDDDDGDDFGDMSREELLELWGVLRRLGWFSLLQDAFTGVMFSHMLAYVRRRYTININSVCLCFFPNS